MDCDSAVNGEYYAGFMSGRQRRKGRDSCPVRTAHKARCFSMSGMMSGARSATRSWVPLLMTTSSALRSNSASRRPTATGLIGSASPHSNSTGHASSPSRWDKSSLAAKNQSGTSGFCSRYAGRQSRAPKAATSSPPEVTERTRCFTRFLESRTDRDDAPHGLSQDSDRL